MNDPIHSSILLSFPEGYYSDIEVKKIQDIIAPADISLNTFPREPEIQAGFGELISEIQIILSNDLVDTICIGLATNAIYDAIKKLLFLVREKHKNNPIIYHNALNRQEERKIHFCIGSCSVILPTDVSDDKYQYFVDKMFDYLNPQNVSDISYIRLNKNNEVQYYTMVEIVEAMKEESKEE